MHVVEPLIDILEVSVMGYIFTGSESVTRSRERLQNLDILHFQITCKVFFNQSWKLSPALDTTECGTTPRAARYELESTKLV